MKWLLLLIAALLAAAPSPAANAPSDRPARPAPVEVRIVTRSGAQMDVWVDGRRLGVTPIMLRTPPIGLLITAGAPGLEPIVHSIDITTEPSQTVTLVDRPLSSERFPLLFAAMVEAQALHPGNPHIVVLASTIAQDGLDAANLVNGLPAAVRQEAMTLYAAGRASLLLGRGTAALEFLDQAIEAEPRLGGLHRVRAQILLQMGEPDRAMADANRAVTLDPLNPDNFSSRAAVHRLAGDERAAQMDIERALELRPDDPKAMELYRKRPGVRPAAP